MQAWRKSTHSQYGTYLKKYLIFCREQNQDPGAGGVQFLLKFLQTMIDQNYSFSAINSAKAAVSLVIHVSEEQKPLLKLFMKGVKNPPKPKICPRGFLQKKISNFASKMQNFAS